jgi:hypothetical protein
MYRLLVGHLPFRAEGQGEVMAMHIFSKARPLREIDPNIPEPIAALVERMMEKDPAERPSMALVAGELERLTGKFTPGGQPVVVLTGNGPLTSGQHSTAPTLPVPSGALDKDSSSKGSEASRQAGDAPRRSRWPIFLLLFLGLLAGAAAVLRPEPVRLLWARLHPPPPKPAPTLVSWSLSSVPAPAQVVRKSDGVVLGVTPWFHEQPAGAGKLDLVIRAPGHSDLEVTFDERISMSRHESLAPLPAADLGVAAPAAAPDMSASPAAPTAAPAGTPPAATPPAGSPPPTPQPVADPQASPGVAPLRKPPVRPVAPQVKKPRPTPAPGTTPGTLTDDDVQIIQ